MEQDTKKVRFRITLIRISKCGGTRGKFTKHEQHYFDNEVIANQQFDNFPRPSRIGVYKLTLEKITLPQILKSKEFRGISL